MPFDLVIRSADLVTPDAVLRADVAIEAGKIVEIAPNIAGAARETLNAAGLHVFPGVIDSHVHFNDAGATDPNLRGDWEGIATGSAALAAGGGTAYFDMPLNSMPATLDGPSFDAKLARACAASHTDFAFWGGLTPQNLDQLEALAERGVVGFKAFMCNTGVPDFLCADDNTLLRGMTLAARLKLPVALHAESKEITARLTTQARAAGRKTYQDYVSSRPIEAEVAAIENAVAFARQTGCALHIVHVSSTEGIRAVLAGAAAGADVTCETCPHYLTFSDDDLFAGGAALKCSPPLRPARAVNTMREYLMAGRINTVGSDHSPAPASLKAGDDALAIWGGVAGVQSTLHALLTIARDALPIVTRVTAANVAARFKLPHKGLIAPGFDADLALIDLNVEYQLSRDDLLDRHKSSPYVGRTFRGRILRTLLRGQTIFQNGKTVGPPVGRFLRPARA